MNLSLIVLTFLISGIAACGAAPKHSAALTDPASAQSQGPAGPPGSQGPQGTRGDAGPTGPAGPAGKEAPGCYLQATDEYLGQTVNGCSMIYFSDKVTAEFDSQGYSQNLCIFSLSNCSGACYAAANAAKKSAWYDGSNWWEVTGKETANPSMPVQSFRANDGTCKALAAGATGNLIELTESWNPPVTLEMPLGTTYIGDGQ